MIVPIPVGITKLVRLLLIEWPESRRAARREELALLPTLELTPQRYAALAPLVAAGVPLRRALRRTAGIET